MKNEKELKLNGFRLLAEFNNYYPLIVKSGIYTYKSLYQNKDTCEIKYIERKTVRGKEEYFKELPLEDLQQLKESHPLRELFFNLTENNTSVEKDSSPKKRM